jgi:hypothetical protein
MIEIFKTIGNNISANPELCLLFLAGLVLSFILGVTVEKLARIYKNKKKG